MINNYGLNFFWLNVYGPPDTELSPSGGVLVSRGYDNFITREVAGGPPEFSTTVGNVVTLEVVVEVAAAIHGSITRGYEVFAGEGIGVPASLSVQELVSETLTVTAQLIDLTAQTGQLNMVSPLLQLAEDVQYSTLGITVVGNTPTLIVFPDWVAIASASSIWTPIIVEP